MKKAYLTNGSILQCQRQCTLRRVLVRRLKGTAPTVKVYYRPSDRYYADMAKHYNTLYKQFIENKEM